MDATYDVVIIGAGPIGGYLSRRFSERGHSVLLVEEHAEIGRPFQCAGLVNPSAMDHVGVEHSILTGIWGARIHSPSGITVNIGDPQRIRTWSVCRKIFDEAVVMQAIDIGADLLLSSKPTSAEVHENHVSLVIETPSGGLSINAKLVCGADGAHSWVRRRFRMGNPRELMIGFQVEVSGYRGKEGKLDMYTGSDLAPGFFAWAIPSGKTTRIGTWTKADLLDGRSCEDLLRKLQSCSAWTSRFEECTEVGRYCGPIPSGFVKRPLIERVALFGDAAGICKPTTGGGIGPGFKQVDLLVPELSQALEEGDLSSKRMGVISKLLEDMSSDQRRKRALRDAFLTESTDSELDEIFKVWSKPEVTALINELGDIENPIPLGMKMLREVPEFRKLVGRAALAVLWG
tara:strand:- start:3365 stop:4570 length:1206 start_codon:yes stop_codon:yes gene_type:complete